MFIKTAKGNLLNMSTVAIITITDYHDGTGKVFARIGLVDWDPILLFAGTLVQCVEYVEALTDELKLRHELLGA